MSVISGTLASNASSTTDYTSAPSNGWHVFDVEATWGGGTVKLQRKGPNGTAVDIGGEATMTANGHAMVWLFTDDEIRVNIDTATGVYARIRYAQEGQ